MIRATCYEAIDDFSAFNKLKSRYWAIAQGYLGCKLSQRLIFVLVSYKGPNVNSIKKYVPAEDGMAIVNLNFDKAEGKMQIAECKYVSQNVDLVFDEATPGITKIPLPKIPPMIMAITDIKERLLPSFFKFLFLRSKT